MTRTHAKDQDKRLLCSKDGVEANGQTDGKVDGQMDGSKVISSEMTHAVGLPTRTSYTLHIRTNMSRERNEPVVRIVEAKCSPQYASLCVIISILMPHKQ